MGLVYKDDEDLNFLQHCTEEQLQIIAGLLTHDEKGKQRLASELLKHQQFQELDNHPEQRAGAAMRNNLFFDQKSIIMLAFFLSELQKYPARFGYFVRICDTGGDYFCIMNACDVPCGILYLHILPASLALQR